MRLSRDLFLGFVRLHILYHASEGPVYGLWLMGKLGRHGYTLSAGTLYPMLHGFDNDGLLDSDKRVVEGKSRTYYHLTQAGADALDEGRKRAVELLNEIRDDSRAC